MELNYWKRYLIVPTTLLTMLLACIEWFSLDLLLEGYIYQLQGGQWLLKDHWLLEDFLHTGARQLVVVFTIFMIIAWFLSFKENLFTQYRSSLCYLLTTSILAAAIVALIKKITQVDCPWYVNNFGGNLQYFSTYSVRPESYPDVSCFPAGHASAGYAWLGIFFVLKSKASKHTIKGLLFVLSLGFILGLTQQIRGAHFLSHDIWTLTICWSVASIFSPMIITRSTSVNAGVSNR